MTSANKHRIGKALMAMGVLVTANAASAVDPVLVDADATGSNNGTSWANAYDNLVDALYEAADTGNVDEIWVAEGTYKPNEGDEDNRLPADCGTCDCTFSMPADVGVYGGFEGGEDGESRRAMCVGGPYDTDDCLSPDDCEDGTCVDTRDFGYCDGGANVGNYCSFHSDCPSASCKNLTILSGDINNNDGDPPDFDNYTYNSWHVVTFPEGTTPDTILDGFTITGGNADGTNLSDNFGGAVLFDDRDGKVWNCAIRKNMANLGGAGIYADGESKAHIVNCVINENQAGEEGGGIMFFDLPEPWIVNCQIVDNHANVEGGGVLLDGEETVDKTTKIVNTLIARNGVPDGKGGAGIATLNSENYTYFVEVINSTVAFNASRDDHGAGGGLHNMDDVEVTIENSIFWGNTGDTGAQIYNDGTSSGTVVADYSNIEDLVAADISGTVTKTNCYGDVSTDNPLFVDDPDDGGDGWGDDPTTSPGDESTNDDPGDLHLQNTSPCAEAGDDDLVAEDKVDLDQDGDITEYVPYDLGGSARIIGVVDMGAYEAILPIVIDIVPADEGTLWRTQKNIVRLTFTGDIPAPGDGDITIKELLAEGAFGPDLYHADDFTLEVEDDTNDDPRILKIQETGSTLEDEKWYAIQNEGGWAGVTKFKVELLDRRGDCDGNGTVLSLDVGCVNAGIPCFVNCGDDNRKDMNGDGRVISLDVGIVNGYLDATTIPKPSGH